MSDILHQYEWQTKIAFVLCLAALFTFIAKQFIKTFQKHYEHKKFHLQQALIQSLYSPLKFFIWALAILYSLEILLLHFVSNDVFEQKFYRLFVLSFIAALTWFCLSFKSKTMEHLSLKSKTKQVNLDPPTIDLLNKLITIFILFVAMLSGLDAIGLNLTTLLAFGGLGGLALAFASQTVISNFFGGLMIYITRPFTVGDEIHIPEKTIKGTVERIGWYMTCIRSSKQTPLYLPNSIFSNVYVETLTRMSYLCIQESILIEEEEKEKLEPLLKDLREEITKHSEIDPSQPSLVTLNGIHDEGIEIQLTVFLKSALRSDAPRLKQEVLLMALAVLARHDIKLAATYKFIIQN